MPCSLSPIMYLVGFTQLAQGLTHGFQQILPHAASGGSSTSRIGLSQLAHSAHSAQRTNIVCVATDVASATPAKQEVKKEKTQRKPLVPGVPVVVGLSHKTATVEVREKLSILEADWNAASKRLCEYEGISEAAVLSTCNRFEVYISAADPFLATRDVMDFLREHSGLSDADLRPNLFVLQNEDATWHLLRVSAGLDSLVVGEGQILSQVKACHSHAISPGSDDEPAGSAGKVLGRLLNSAVMAGKWIRSETEIAKGAVSISSAAVELATLKAPEDLNKPLSELRVTIVGAGKMSRLLMTHLASHGVTKIVLLNRSRPRAEELAAEYPDMDVEVLLMDSFWEVMERTDLAFTSTSATGCIVTQPGLEEHGWGGEERRDLMLIDISVPRNVESECNDVGGVVAYNVDDLKQVVAANQAKRAHKVLEAEVLLRVELAKFVAWQESLKYVPAISKLQGKFETVRQAEMAKAQRKALKNLSDKERQAVDVLTKGIINKLLHGPMAYLRSDDHDGGKATVQQINELFLLKD